jgi:hypothetical protein
MRNILIIAVLLSLSAFSQAQSTAFTYQGKLTDAGAPASGTYLMQFSLWDAASGGTQIGSTVTNNSVTVTNGIFTVPLDFGSSAFDGGGRWLEIAVKKSAEPSFMTLSPRQSVTSAPYAVKSLKSGTADIANDSTQLGGLAAGQYVQTSDTRMTDARTPTPGNANYIQNGTSTQASSNFKISGTGSAGIFDAATQYNLNGFRFLSADSFNNNLFEGQGAGSFNSTGFQNTFVGQEAGLNNQGGSGNSYFGNSAGQNNQSSNSNSFFGSSAGQKNGGSSNSFFGAIAGQNNLGGIGNTFVGRSSGQSNTNGNLNTVVGFFADVSSADLSNASAIGAEASVTQSNSIVLGSINGVNNATADTSVAIGTTAPLFRLHVIDTSNAGLRVQTNTAGGTVASFGGNGAFQVDSPGSAGGRLQITENADTNIGFGVGMSGNLNVRGSLQTNGVLLVVGTATVDTLGSSGSTSLCRNSSLVISTCSSSLRYKTNIGKFSSGLDLIRQLRPITFNWKQDGMKDVGFGAEDVAKINSLFVTYNDKGEVEGVKYDRLSVAFVNAFKEQQTQIERQQKEIDELKQIVNSLKTRISSRGRVGYRRH